MCIYHPFYAELWLLSESAVWLVTWNSRSLQWGAYATMGSGVQGNTWWGEFSSHTGKLLMKTFLEYWNVPLSWNNSLHKTSNDNGVQTLNFATSKDLVVKSTHCTASTGHTISFVY
jgi:hypothetical protein